MIYMPNKNYINGRAKEYRVKKQLESEGWFCVRSAGSHSIVDIVAIKASPFGGFIFEGRRIGEYLHVRFIQCKPKGGYLSPAERKAKAELEVKLGVEIEVM